MKSLALMAIVLASCRGAGRPLPATGLGGSSAGGATGGSGAGDQDGGRGGKPPDPPDAPPVVEGPCPQLPPPDRKPAKRSPVVIISVDGLRPDAIAAAPAPRLLELLKLGASTLAAHTSTLSLTVPAHASMISGLSSETHGIDWDYPREYAFCEPTVLGLATAAHLRASLVSGKEKLRQLVPPGRGRVEILLGTDEEVATRALSEMDAGFDVLWVHLPQVDYAGHAYGWMSPDYLAAVRLADTAVGRLYDAAPADTTFILSADHGGSAYHHNTTSEEDHLIPWIIVGPGVRRGATIHDAVTTMDTAATAAAILGLKWPGPIQGRPVRAAF